MDNTSALHSHFNNMADPVAFKQTILALKEASLNTNTAHPILSLSTKAKHLSRYLVDGTALPSFLTQHSDLLTLLTDSAALASGLYYFFRHNRTNRQKVQIAAFHIFRMVEKLPGLQVRLQDPLSLIAEFDKDVSSMIGSHLSTREAADVMKELRRKVWTRADEERTGAQVAKRSKTGNTGPQLLGETGAELVQVSTHVVMVEEHDADVDMLDVPEAAITPRTEHAHGAEVPTSAQEPSQRASIQEVSSSPREIASLPMVPISISSDRITYKYPSSSESEESSSSPTPTPSERTSILKVTPSHRLAEPQTSSTDRLIYKYPSSSSSQEEIPTPTPAPRGGVGLDYDDPALYTPEVSPVTSTEVSPTAQQHSPSAVKAKPHSMLKEAVDRAMGKKSNNDRPYHTPVLVLAKPPLQPPRNTKAFHTPLGDIPEGSSPHISPPAGTNRYRVAEGKKLHKELKQAKIERDALRKLMAEAERKRQIDEIVRVQQEQGLGDAPTEDADWPDAVLAYPSSNDDEGEMDISKTPSVRSLDSPPSATEISPALPSPPSTAETSSADEDGSEMDVSGTPSLSSLDSPPSATPISPALPSPLEGPTAPEISSPNLPDLPSSPLLYMSSSPLSAAPVVPAVDELQTPTPTRDSASPPSASPNGEAQPSVQPVASTPPTKKRGRPRKVPDASQASATPTPPSRGRGRPRKIPDASQASATPTPPSRGRGRPRKVLGDLQAPATPTPQVKRTLRPRKETPFKPQGAPGSRSARAKKFTGVYSQ
jgi:hypothetical protein